MRENIKKVKKVEGVVLWNYYPKVVDSLNADKERFYAINDDIAIPGRIMDILAFSARKGGMNP